MALQALETDEGYLERLRHRWTYILEDEAQDSSELQEKILALIRQLHAQDEDTRDAAVANLLKIGSAAVPSLIDAVNDGDAVLCANAIEILGQIKDTLNKVETL